MRKFTNDQRIGWLLILLSLCCAVAAYAMKPPEKLEDIDCSIFDALPILEEVRPFMVDVQAPDQLDFKTRIAYVDDWAQRRAVAATRLDRLIEVCRIKLSEQQKSGD